ncbi:CBS domain-containing protein [Caulobacter sp. DWR2-3-1b2]|uniref:CBS domain-containing protein n=1 Tax=unclassified Caulobacter TaxID=2648921 RepID=UPI003CF31D46
MNVSECMSTDVRVCALDDTIGDAARTMKENDAGLLPVGENDRLVGMFTDRDMAVRAMTENSAAGALHDERHVQGNGRLILGHED